MYSLHAPEDNSGVRAWAEGLQAAVAAGSPRP